MLMRETKVLATVMNKGGAGKTSLITNIAALLAEKGKKTLIIDTDGQGNSSLAFGKIPNNFAYTIADVFLGTHELRAVTVNLAENLDLVPANDDMNMLEFEVLTRLDMYPQPFKLIEKQVNTIRGDYDYILIDMPPAMGLITGNVLMITDEILIPFVPESFGVQGFIRVVEAVKEFEEEQGKSVNICGVVGMMVDKRTSLHNEMITEAKMYCSQNEIHLFNTVIPRSIRFASATAYNQAPAVWVERSNPIVNAYRSLLLELLEVLQ